MNKALYLIGAALLLQPGTLFAHPGRTAADGCHYCRTNCDKWGEIWDERHCHNGVTTTTPTPPPIPTPIAPAAPAQPSSTPTALQARQSARGIEQSSSSAQASSVQALTPEQIEREKELMQKNIPSDPVQREEDDNDSGSATVAAMIAIFGGGSYWYAKKKKK